MPPLPSPHLQQSIDYNTLSLTKVDIPPIYELDREAAKKTSDSITPNSHYDLILSDRTFNHLRASITEGCDMPDSLRSSDVQLLTESIRSIELKDCKRDLDVNDLFTDDKETSSEIYF